MTTAAFITGYLGKTAAASPIFGAEGWTADTGIGRTNENNASRDLVNTLNDPDYELRKRQGAVEGKPPPQFSGPGLFPDSSTPTLDGESSLPPLPDSWRHDEPPGEWVKTPPADNEDPAALMDDAMKGNYPDQTHPDQDPPSWLSRWSSPEFEWGAEGQVTDAGVGAGIGSIASALLDFARDKPVSVRRMILMAIMGGAAGALFNAVGGWEGIKSTFPSSHPSIA
jgi:hypothetical protein